MWAAQRFRSRFPRTFHGSGGLGTMGFSLPTAIGACYGISSLEEKNRTNMSSQKQEIQERKIFSKEFTQDVND